MTSTMRWSSGRHALVFAPAAECFASSFADGRWLGIGTDTAINLVRIEAFSQADAKP